MVLQLAKFLEDSEVLEGMASEVLCLLQLEEVAQLVSLVAED